MASETGEFAVAGGTRLVARCRGGEGWAKEPCVMGIGRRPTACVGVAVAVAAGAICPQRPPPSPPSPWRCPQRAASPGATEQRAGAASCDDLLPGRGRFGALALRAAGFDRAMHPLPQVQKVHPSCQSDEGRIQSGARYLRRPRRITGRRAPRIGLPSPACRDFRGERGTGRRMAAACAAGPSEAHACNPAHARAARCRAAARRGAPISGRLPPGAAADEAGRGPVLGPMVYAAAYAPLSYDITSK
eukprot:366341-Chlamydomonas_euryale.AAC.4